MDSEEFRSKGRDVINLIAEYYSTVSEKLITHDKREGFLRESLPDSAPEKPESFDKILEDVRNLILPGIVHWRHPRYFGFFPSGSSYPSILADMLISATNCAGFSWAAGPACTELETITLDWLGKMIGLPQTFLSCDGKKGGGVFQVSSTDATLVTVIAARHVKAKALNRRNPCLDKRAHLPFFMAYCSKITHASVTKIAEVAMVQVRLLDTDSRHRLRGETLEKAMKEDREKGMIPFYVYASLGTTAVCSCDVLEEIGPVCEKFEVWLHVDSAYAGSAMICPELKHFLRGIEFADSFSVDPSMWMLMNFDCCAMWVQDRFKLTESLITSPLYLDYDFAHNCIDYRHWGVSLSRRFRALKLWFVLRNYGVKGLQNYIRKHIALAKKFEFFVRCDCRFTMENVVDFGIVCFRLKGSNDLNAKLLSSVNESRKVFLVGTILGGRYVIRFCICAEQVEEKDVYFAWELISHKAREVLSEEVANKKQS